MMHVAPDTSARHYIFWLIGGIFGGPGGGRSRMRLVIDYSIMRKMMIVGEAENDSIIG